MSAHLSVRYRTAFLTGASTGLGQAFTEMLLAEGVQVWGTSRNLSRLAARPGFHPVALELGDGSAAEEVFLHAEKEAGGFDLVVNNAGFGVFGEFTRTEFSVWQAQLEIMLVNTARLSHLALAGMLARRRGALVNISSLAVQFPLPYQAAYNMAKAGLSALNESLMYELRGTGVVVIDFQPADFRTDFEQSVVRPPQAAPENGAGTSDRPARVWHAFGQMMRGAPPPALAAAALCRALHRGRSGTVRTGAFFQATVAPFLARLAPLALKRYVQARYFGL